MKGSILVLAVFLVAGTGASAQYYYKDIVSNKQLIDEMAWLKDQKIKAISIKSFEDDGSPSDGFSCEKKISRNYGMVETFSNSNVTGPSLFTTLFDKNGRLEKTTDSSNIAVTTVRYEYGENGKIINIRSGVRSSDDDFNNEIREEHFYQYDMKGNFWQMIRVKNGTDSSRILVSYDERNNVSIEKDSHTGKSYYYYYDAKNRLTDVVHLNEFNEKMLPDYIFEYNGAGQLVQMTTTEEGGSYYYIWKYTYDNGLRSSEKCFSKEKRLMGSIQYEYK